MPSFFPESLTLKQFLSNSPELDTYSGSTVQLYSTALGVSAGAPTTRPLA